MKKPRFGIPRILSGDDPFFGPTSRPILTFTPPVSQSNYERWKAKRKFKGKWIEPPEER